MHNLGLIKHHYKHYQLSNLTSVNLNSSNGNLHTDYLRSVRKRTGKRLQINISGQLFETYEATLDKYPETILGTPEKRRLLTNPKNGIIFLNRHRDSFEAILFFFQSSGNLVHPQNILMSDFVKECRFYQIPESAIKRMKHRECFLYTKRKDLPDGILDLRKQCWLFIENPKECGGTLPLLYFAFSYCMILCSIILYCFHSEILLHKNLINVSNYLFYQERIELGLNLFFAVDLVIRYMVCPVRKNFLLEPINFLETISVISYLVIAATLLPGTEPGETILKMSRTLYTFRITRLGRVSKIVRMSFTVFQEAVEDVLVVLFTMSIIIIFSGTVMYYLELNIPNTQFTSIPESMWWAVQTSICLGYGDIVPETYLSRYVGLAVLYGGVVIVMVLILSLGGRVFDMYIKEFDENSGGFLNITTKKEDYEIKYKD